MQIQVRYFAVFRERLRKDAETIELADGTTVTAALDLLADRHEVIGRLRGRYQVADMACATSQTIRQVW